MACPVLAQSPSACRDRRPRRMRAPSKPIALLPITLVCILLVLLRPSTASAGTVGVVPLSGDAPSAPRLLAALDEQERTVRFTTMAPIQRTDDTARTMWKSLQLSISGPAPSALAAGVLWSTPNPLRIALSNATLPATTTETAAGTNASTALLPSSQPLPFVAVASGRTLRFFVPGAASASTSSATSAAASFASQTLLTAAGQLVTETQGILCACSLSVDSAASIPGAQLFVSDSVGRMVVLRLNESRTIAGGSSGAKAWTVQQPSQPLVLPAGLSGNGLTEECPPCNGGAVLAASAPDKPGGAFYSPRAARTLSSFVGLDRDGRVDYIVVRSFATNGSNLPAAASPLRDVVSSDDPAQKAARNMLGLEVSCWYNNGSDAAGFPQFVPVNNFLSGVPSSGVAASETSRLVRMLTAALNNTSSPQRLVRMPDSLAIGHFDSDSAADIVLGVTDFIEGAQLQTADSTTPGVFVQRRLVTLFGLPRAPNGPPRFRFDGAEVSVSSSLGGADVFLPNTKLQPYTAATSINTLSFSPLLSSVLSLVDEGELNEQDTLLNITAVSSAVLLPSTALTASSVLQSSLQPFPFTVFASRSPFYDPNATLLQEHQRSTLAVMEHSFGREGGRLLRLQAADDSGRWSVRPDVEASSSGNSGNTAAMEELAVGREPKQALPLSIRTTLIDLGDSVASTLDVLPSGMVANPNAVLSFLPTSPHAAVVLSSSEAFPTLASGSAADLALQTNTFSSDGSSSLLWTAPQLFYSIPTPAVSTLLLNVSSSSVPNSSEPPPSREQQRQFKLRFDLAVAEYARASGWTEGIRMQPRGLFMEKRAHDEPEWHRILNSPVTWTLLAVCAGCVLAGLYVLWRARDRCLNQRRLRSSDELLAVVAAGAPVPPHIDEMPPPSRSRTPMAGLPPRARAAAAFNAMSNSRSGGSSSGSDSGSGDKDLGAACHLRAANQAPPCPPNSAIVGDAPTPALHPQAGNGALFLAAPCSATASAAPAVSSAAQLHSERELQSSSFVTPLINVSPSSVRHSADAQSPSFSHVLGVALASPQLPPPPPPPLLGIEADSLGDDSHEPSDDVQDDEDDWRVEPVTVRVSAASAAAAASQNYFFTPRQQRFHTSAGEHQSSPHQHSQLHERTRDN